MYHEQFAELDAKNKPALTIKMVKRTIGYDSEEEEVHDVRRGIVNMAMNDAQET